MFTLRPLARGIRCARPAFARPAVCRPAFSSFPAWKASTRADTVMEDITELYATAKDEFEIAMEETEKATVYAEADREAAKEELKKLQDAFKKILDGDDKELAEEIQKRVGSRIRELAQGVQRMEELAMEHD